MIESDKQEDSEIGYWKTRSNPDKGITFGMMERIDLIKKIKDVAKMKNTYVGQHSRSK